MANKSKNKMVRVSKPSKKKTKQKQAEKEMTILGKALRSLGGLAGGAAGGLIGMSSAGASAGTGLGAALSRWLGSGDYTVSQNSLVHSVKASGSIPSMHSNDQTVVVRHKEYLGEVLSNTSFTVQKSLRINPGDAATFPWLSRIANNYQQYRIKGMVFHYIPSSGSAVASTNNALGTVMMQTSYRSNDTAPSTKVELLNEYWSSEAVPSETFCHPIECNPNENPFNIQYIAESLAVIPAKDSPLLYDLGVTHIATSGQQTAGVVLGDLWCTYEIELKKPIIESNVTGASGWYASAQVASPSQSLSDWFPTSVNTNVGNLYLTLSGRSITFPKSAYGTFYVHITVRPASGFTSTASWDMNTGVTTTGLTQISYSPYNHSLANSGNITSANVGFICVAVVKTDLSSTGTLTFSTPVGNGTIAGGYVEVNVFGANTIA